uniref:Uncharacterized protein n=1 Tax=Cannabis sativa TaxID=3483 RepID=A0A803QXE3_CANSA
MCEALFSCSIFPNTEPSSSVFVGFSLEGLFSQSLSIPAQTICCCWNFFELCPVLQSNGCFVARIGDFYPGEGVTQRTHFLY